MNRREFLNISSISIAVLAILPNIGKQDPDYEKEIEFILFKKEDIIPIYAMSAKFKGLEYSTAPIHSNSEELAEKELKETLIKFIKHDFRNWD